MNINNLLSNLDTFKYKYEQLINSEDAEILNNTIEFLKEFKYEPKQIESWICPKCNNIIKTNKNMKNIKTHMTADLEGNMYNNYIICCEKCSYEMIFYSDKWIKVS